MSNWYGNYVVVQEVDEKIITESITKLIHSISVKNNIEWETLQLIIKKPDTGYSPFDTVITEDPETGEEVLTLKYWTIGVKAKGTAKDEGRYQKENLLDHQKE